MKVCTNINEIRAILTQARTSGKSIGLVPTMGALHAGHASLIAASSARDDITVVSIFVNPTQFAPNEDLAKYPRTFEADKQLASAHGAQIIFYPDVAELYPDGEPTWVEVTGDITKVLCGKSRPIHFRGVTTVVSKLFNIIKPTRAYFGQKDAQQVQVLKKMVRDLMFDLELIVLPIIRESDGLALSSRNIYLSTSERAAALVLSTSLQLAQSAFSQGERNPEKILTLVLNNIATEKLATVDYVEIWQLPDLTCCTNPMQASNLLAVAVYFGKTRLIDNIILEA